MTTSRKLAVFLCLLGLGWAMYALKQDLSPMQADTFDTKVTTAIIQPEPSKITVRIHVAGAVAMPGVYDVSPHLRILDVLDMAGGALDGANLDRVNLASLVKDGQRILLPYSDKTPSKRKKKTPRSPVTPVFPIQLNLADAKTLESVPGIGPAMAKRIVLSRQREGRFHRLEELTRVKGIGTKTLKRLRPYLAI